MASGMMDWISEHPDIALAGGAVGVLLIAGSLFKAKTPTTGSTTQDLSGLHNGIVYVPTQTSFTTENKSGVFASNDPALTSVTTGPVNSPTTTTTTTTKTSTGGDADTSPPTCRSGYHYEAQRMGFLVVAGAYPVKGGYCVPNSTGPIKLPPPPGPNPPPTTKSLKWDTSYTIIGGDTLSAIAARLTARLRAQGMPGSMSITWSDLYGHNTAKINSYAQQHGFRSDYWNWIFPGETITVPRWG